MTLITFLVGLIIGALVVALFYLKSKNNVQLKWYHWLLIVLTILFGIATVIFVNSFAEESVGGGIVKSLLVFGLPTLVLFIVSWQLILHANKTA